MTTTRKTTKSLGHKGTIHGLVISNDQNQDLCTYYGGVRYALKPSERWRQAKPLPETYTYGTADYPGDCTTGAGVCPQPGFLSLSPETPDIWDEDCFQCNVWVPIGDVPEGGWPVFVFLHGGWLQFGTPNSFNAAALIGETDFKCVVVMPAYRVNLFGFLYSAELEADAASVGESVGNHGFWDQRLALEWTRENVGLFGGDTGNITISGYSAGANSVFHQLAYDLRQPPTKTLIQNVCIWSNSPAVQPKQPSETQAQFNELLTALSIPLSLPSTEKLARLRSIPSKALIDITKTLTLHQFRPTTDGTFILPSLFGTLDNGSFAATLLSRNIKIMTGECADEHFLYNTWFPPKSNTLAALRTRLIADYPEHIVDTLMGLYYPDGKLPENCRNWNVDAWGRCYADMQVHKIQRGFLHALTSNSAGVDASRLLYRYRIEWRAKCVAPGIPVEWGVTHSSDYPVWFWGNGKGLEEAEKEIIGRAFVGPLCSFVKRAGGNSDGGEFGWGTSGPRTVRTLKGDGRVVICEDEAWEDGVRVWKRLRDADKGKARL